MQSIDSGSQILPGVFVTLEGPDGAGKSVAADFVLDQLRRAGRDVLLTREPGGTALGESIRNTLLASGSDHDPLADALLFNAARRQLVAEVIRPALAAGNVVVCDRFADSTLAYQGYGAGVDIATLSTLADIATDLLRPTRTVLLDLPVEVGLARRRGGPSAEMTRFETGDAFDTEFHERVRRGYLEMAAREPERWRVVDATLPVPKASAAVWAAVRDLF